jgi:hypothetical protein
MEALQYDEHNAEDAASHPHHLTHAPEALRYGVMSDAAYYGPSHKEKSAFRFPKREAEGAW